MDVLYFQIEGAPYAIAQETIADVAPAGAIRPVPLSPRAVLGLAERRGRPVAVIDLPSLLDAPQSPAPHAGHLMRLTGSLEGTALFVPAPVYAGQGTAAPSDHVAIEGRLHRLLNADALVKQAGATY